MQNDEKNVAALLAEIARNKQSIYQFESTNLAFLNKKPNIIPPKLPPAPTMPATRPPFFSFIKGVIA